MEIKKGDKKLMRAWAMYDWANSVYPLVITTAVFPLFYENVVAEEIELFGTSFSRLSVYSYTLAASLLLISIISPILSGVADYTGRKRLFMKIFNYIGAGACVLMYFIQKDGSLFYCLALVFLANVGFWGSLVFYNSYLPEVAHPEDQDALSAKGFSLGYLGSSLLLIIILAGVLSVSTGQLDIMRYGFVVTGIWWIGFSQIAYKYLPKNTNGKKVTKDVLGKGLKELKGVWEEFSGIYRLRRFLRAFFVYGMAVQTIMTMAQFFGTEEIDWSYGMEVLEDKEAMAAAVKAKMSSAMIIAILLIQFIAIPGALIFAWISKKYGNVKGLLVAMVMWIGITVGAYWVDIPIWFYVLGGFVGFVMGGTQALSRSTYSKFLPETEDTASYFSFYDVLEKIGLAIGIVTFGFIEDHFDIRSSVVALAGFFIIGFILLMFVPRKKEESIQD